MTKTQQVRIILRPLLLLLMSLIPDWLCKHLSTVPGPPVSLSVVNITSDAVTLRWLRPAHVPGILQGYRVERQLLVQECNVEVNASCVEREVILSVNVLENGPREITVTLQPLRKYRHYRIRVVAWTNAGAGEPSEWLYAHTLAGSMSYAHTCCMHTLGMCERFRVQHVAPCCTKSTEAHVGYIYF